jgi:hypothetical protein
MFKQDDPLIPMPELSTLTEAIKSMSKQLSIVAHVYSGDDLLSDGVDNLISKLSFHGDVYIYVDKDANVQYSVIE